MSPRDRISDAIRSARGGTAVVAFVTAGFPSRDKFREHLVQVLLNGVARDRELGRDLIGREPAQREVGRVALPGRQ